MNQRVYRLGEGPIEPASSRVSDFVGVPVSTTDPITGRVVWPLGQGPIERPGLRYVVGTTLPPLDHTARK